MRRILDGIEKRTQVFTEHMRIWYFLRENKKRANTLSMDRFQLKKGS